MTTDNDASRKAFEASINEFRLCYSYDRNSRGEYWEYSIELAWKSWQASRKVAMEDAAKICDEQATEPECPERAVYCAEAIRRLK